MKPLYALPLIGLLALAPWAMAQQQAPAPDGPDYEYTPPLADPPQAAPDGSMDEGVDLIQRGTELFFRNLLNEMAPEIDGISRDLADALELLGPAVTDLSVLVDDISNYQTPEILENGDIIIRRDPNAPPPPAVGQGLRELGRQAPRTVPDTPPVDPDQPEIEL